MKPLLKIHPSDNVAVALRDLHALEEFDGVTAQGDVPRAHKLALAPIRAGSDVIKYGYPIGRATRDIAAGDHVHLHNLASTLKDDLSLSFSGVGAARPRRPSPPRTFPGFRRPGGRVGIRNDIWIINTVGCVNQVSEKIAAAARQQIQNENLDGIFSFSHPYGCSQLGDDLLNTQKVLAGLIRHPNAAGVLVLGLGCENNQMKLLFDQVGSVDPRRIKFFNAQEVSDEIAEGVRAVSELAEYASTFAREPVPASELILGMKCGGSDGFSGITANPLVGRVADLLAAQGGTSLLSEVPEMFGAEPMLLERAASAAVFDDTVRMVNEFRDYFRRHDQPIDENPAPGNKDGGISTLAEKSLGCVQKAGHAPVAQVLAYGQPATPGLGGVALVNAPGNDGVSSTAMTVAGAHMLLFTTGRGTPLGMPVPTLKIATNTALAERKPTWIDFNAGTLADGEADIDALAAQLFELVLDIASGKKQARNEINNNREITIWKSGVTV